MERLKARVDLFNNAISTLDIVLQKFEKLTPQDQYYQELRDSTIHRFEYSMDTFWKLLKEYLETHYGVEAIPSPKAIFKTSLDLKLMSDQEYKQCIKMIDDKILSASGYYQHIAIEIGNAIPANYTLMKTISSRIYPSIHPSSPSARSGYSG